MFTALLLLAAAAPQTAVDAERAFADDARTGGQWTAFRRWAADDAVMFVPQPQNAQAFLAPLKDSAKAIDWWPTASYVSCDGGMAVNTGGWRRPDGSVGYFSTVWVRQMDGGWKWTVDGGDKLAAARPKPADPRVRIASCAGKPAEPPTIGYREGPSMTGTSSDGTIAYHWHVSSSGARTFSALLWDGVALVPVLSDSIAAPE